MVPLWEKSLPSLGTKQKQNPPPQKKNLFRCREQTVTGAVHPETNGSVESGLMTWKSFFV